MVLRENQKKIIQCYIVESRYNASIYDTNVLIKYRSMAYARSVYLVKAMRLVSSSAREVESRHGKVLPLVIRLLSLACGHKSYLFLKMDATARDLIALIVAQVLLRGSSFWYSLQGVNSVTNTAQQSGPQSN